MAPEHEPLRRLASKITKKKPSSRSSSVQFPDRLREGDDAQEDVTAAKGKPAQYMNQSIFSMIAAAGSKADFHARFEEESSGSDEEQDLTEGTLSVEGRPSIPETQFNKQREDASSRAEAEKRPQDLPEGSTGKRRSIPRLHLRTTKEKNYMSQSTRLLAAGTSSSLNTTKGITPRDAPVMGRMLEAQAELRPSTLPPESKNPEALEPERLDGKGMQSTLALRLKEIFGLKEAEEVISGTPGNLESLPWLIRRQSILAGFYRVFYFRATFTFSQTTSASMPTSLRNRYASSTVLLIVRC